jgi:hypothetical protein
MVNFALVVGGAKCSRRAVVLAVALGACSSGGAARDGAADGTGAAGAGGHGGAAGDASGAGGAHAGGAPGDGQAGSGGAAGDAGIDGGGGSSGDAGDAPATGGAGGGAGGGGAGGAHADAGMPCQGVCVTTLAIEGEHLVYDPSRGLLYASVAGAAANYANTITTVDPVAARVTSTLPIGSDPRALALSQDGSALWAGMDGAFSIRKVNLGATPPTLGPMRMLPVAPTALSVYVTAQALVALPGAPDSVAAMTGRLLILDDGVARPNALLFGANTVVAGPPGFLFGMAANSPTNALAVISVTAAGLSQTSVGGLFDLGGLLLYRDGRLYSTGGEVIDVSDPTKPSRMAKFGFSGSIADPGPGRLLMLTSPLPTVTSSAPWQLRLLETENFTQVTSVSIPTSALTPDDTVQDLVFAGGDRVALLAGDFALGGVSRLVIVESDIIGPAPPPADGGVTADGGGAGGADAQGGGAGGTAGGAGGASGAGGAPCIGCTIVTLPVEGRRMVYDAPRSRLYVTVQAGALANANSVVVVDPTAGAVTGAIPIGKNPDPLALSVDGSTLWVALTDDHAVRKVTLTASPPLVGTAQTLPAYTVNTTTSPASASTMVALPDSPVTIAASLSGGLSGTRVFVLDDGVPRPTDAETRVPASRLAAGQAGFVYGFNDHDSGADFTSFAVSAAGATQIAALEGLFGSFQSDILYDSGRVYGRFGEVVDVSDPTKPIRAGQFAFNGALAVRDPGHLLMLSPTFLMISSDGPQVLRVLDTSTFTQITNVPLPDSLIPATSDFRDLVYLGGDGVAFLSEDGNNRGILCILHAQAILSP